MGVSNKLSNFLQHPLHSGPDVLRVLYLVLVSLALCIVLRCTIVVLAVVAAH